MSARTLRRAHERDRARRRARRAKVAGGLAAGASLAFAASADAATFTVNSLSGSVTIIGCNNGPGDYDGCSLRDAVNAANASSGPDDIVFALPSGPQTINLGGDDLEITQSVTITGPGAANVDIDAGAAAGTAGFDGDARAFDVRGTFARAIDVEIEDVTISGGKSGQAGAPFVAQPGGAIRADFADLRVESSVITGNVASGRGGAIHHDGRTDYYGEASRLAVVDSRIEDNTTYQSGGGISVGGEGGLDVIDTEVSGNDATYMMGTSPGLSPRGGGIDKVSSGPLLIQDATIADNAAAGSYFGFSYGRGGGADLSGFGEIIDSRITGNSAAQLGGGLTIDGDMSVERTTISGNSASGDGGGGVQMLGGVTIRASTITGNSGPAGGGIQFSGSGNRLLQSTVSGNVASSSGGGLWGVGAITVRNATIAANSAAGGGGGIQAAYADPPNVTIRSSIVADNTPTGTDLASGGQRVFGVEMSLIEGPEPGVIVPEPPDSNVIGVDPLLGPLADNGGPTRTMLPGAASPAIDAGFAGFGLDQRGLSRTVDATAPNEPFSDGTDIGAVELQDASAPGDDDATPPETAITAGPSGSGNAATATFSFDSPSDGTASFECSLDGAPFTACSSPVSFSGLADGAHSFEVRARDAAGNIDPTPATRLFVVGSTSPEPTGDTRPPATVISEAPASLVAKSKKKPATAKVAFEGIDDITPPGAIRFECKLDTSAFAPCSSPTSLKLKKGTHTFAVRAVDAAGNADPSPATRTVKVTVKKRKR